MRGGRSKPTELKLMQGTQRPSRSKKDEPKPKPAKMRPPSHLTGPAKKEWARMAAKLHPLGLLTEIDVPALELYCETYARWLDAKDKVTEKGAVLVTSNGNLVQNPYLAVANKSQDQMLKILAEFGMTPSSRTRVSASVPDADNKDIEKQLFG